MTAWSAVVSLVYLDLARPGHLAGDDHVRLFKLLERDRELRMIELVDAIFTISSCT